MFDLRSEIEDEALVDSFATDWRTADLPQGVREILMYTDKLTSAPANCDESDVAMLRQVGWSDVAISDAVQVCSYFNYINRIANGLGVDEENWLDALGKERQ